jgi:hypothetical protein
MKKSELRAIIKECILEGLFDAGGDGSLHKFKYVLLNKGNKVVEIEAEDNHKAYEKLVKKYGKGLDPMWTHFDGKKLKW